MSRSRLSRLLAVPGILLSFACESPTPPLDTTLLPAVDTTRLHFASPVSVESLAAVARRTAGTIVAVEHEFLLHGERTKAIYTPSLSEDISRGIMRAHDQFLSDMIASETGSESATSQAVSGALTVSSLVVTAISLEIPSDRASHGMVLPPSSPTLASPSAGLPVAHAQSYTKADSWVPKSGKITVGESGKSERYVRQDMIWDNTSGFTDGSTYEHDFFLNNNSGSELGKGVYLDAGKSRTGIPSTTYVSSNLPLWYLDTRVLDGGSEIAYTIGSAYPKSLVKKYAYFTYIQTKNGTAKKDNGKLQAQLGHRSPDFCFSTWCSYSDQKATLVSAWDVPAPGTRSWTR